MMMMLLRAFDVSTPFSVMASFLVVFFLPLLPTTYDDAQNPKPFTTMKREAFFQIALSNTLLSLSRSLSLFDVVVVVGFRARCGRGRRRTTT